MVSMIVTSSTSTDEIRETIGYLFLRSHRIDAELAARPSREIDARLRDMRDAIHDEIERLTNIVIVRRRHAPVVA